MSLQRSNVSPATGRSMDRLNSPTPALISSSDNGGTEVKPIYLAVQSWNCTPSSPVGAVVAYGGPLARLHWPMDM